MAIHMNSLQTVTPAQAFFNACEGDSFEAIDDCILAEDHPISPETTLTATNQNGLHVACEWSPSSKVVQFFIKHYPKLAQKKDSEGFTPLLRFATNVGFKDTREDFFEQILSVSDVFEHTLENQNIFHLLAGNDFETRRNNKWIRYTIDYLQHCKNSIRESLPRSFFRHEKIKGLIMDYAGGISFLLNSKDKSGATPIELAKENEFPPESIALLTPP
jgi:hypothetical protein